MQTLTQHQGPVNKVKVILQPVERMIGNVVSKKRTCLPPTQPLAINVRERSENQTIPHKLLNTDKIEGQMSELDITDCINSDMENTYLKYKTLGSSQNLEAENEFIRHQISQLKDANNRWKTMNNDMLNVLLNH
jgi:hypothetical protein